MKANLEINIHGVPTEVFDTLARVFGEQTAEGHVWITLNVEGVKVTFFAAAGAAAVVERDVTDELSGVPA